MKLPLARVRRAGWVDVLPGMVLAFAGMAVAGTLIWFQVVDPARRAYAEQLAAARADNYASLIDGRVSELRAQLDAAAGATSTRAALGSRDAAQLAEAGRHLTQLMPHTDRVEIIPEGEAEVDLEAAVPITFAALRVIRAAASDGFAGPEGIRLDDQRTRLFAARALEADGVSGVLFVALSEDFFLEPLRAFHGEAGQVSLVQRFDHVDPLVLMRWGESPSGGYHETAARRSLQVPHWFVEFDTGALSAPPLEGTFLRALAVGSGLVLGGLLLTLLVVSRKLRLTQEDLTELARAMQPAPAALPPVMSQMQADGEPPIAHDATPAQPGSDAPAGPGGPGNGLSDEPPQPRGGRDDDFLEVTPDDDNFGIEVVEDTSPRGLGLQLEPEIFRAYDIRGITTGNLSEEVTYWIGRAFAAQALEQDQPRVAVGRDGRHSSAPLAQALTRGLTEGGLHVLDVGEVPTPVLYYATHMLRTGTGIMITGSHNPPEYNGLKLMIAGETLADESIQALRARIEENRLSTGAGAVEQIDVAGSYLAEIVGDVVVAQPLKVVVDCGNGVAGHLAPELIAELGCEVVSLYCDVDGDFPNHHPDPADPKNLTDLITVVQAEEADLGLAFDGDGDRIGVVTGSGRIIWPDQLLMLFAEDIVGRNPGADIIYDVKCSRHLNTLIGDLGGRPIMWKTGHSHMKAKLRETKALLAGEFSGHICFGERWYGFDDALYAAARLLELLATAGESADAVFDRFPKSLSTPELKLQTTERAKFGIIEQLATRGDFGGGTITTIDGLRVDYSDGWGLIRASNTSPVLTLRFEADDTAALERIQALFQEQLLTIDNQLLFR
jgi:phosphomannomutase / phosphoglucomutase